MGKFKDVEENEFNQFIHEYPNELKTRTYTSEDEITGANQSQVHYYDDTINPDVEMSHEEVVAYKSTDNTIFRVLND
jgi:hypothetical protein